MKPMILLPGFVLAVFLCMLSCKKKNNEREYALVQVDVYESTYVELANRVGMVSDDVLARIQESEGELSLNDPKTTVITENEIAQIWNDALKTDPDILQSEVHIGENDGFGVDLKLHPDKQYSLAGTSFSTEVGGIEVRGAYGTTKTEFGDNTKFVSIQNANTLKPGASVEVKLVMKY